MKRTIIFTAIIFSMSVFCSAQQVEKIGTNNNIKYICYHSAQGCFPTGLYIDEINNTMTCYDPALEIFYYYNLNDIENIEFFKEKRSCPFLPYLEKIGNDYWGITSYGMTYILENEKYKYIENVQSGISFILKKGNGYIVYYVDDSGYPGAVDTTGRIYSSEEAMAYLKEYDPEKYKQSEKRAAELELYNDFIRNRVLIWGKTYYTTTYIMEKFYGKNDPYILNGLIQYDKNGYGYQLSFDIESTDLCIVNPEGKRNMFVQIDNGYKHLLKNEYSGLSSSWYVGYGGNIYYYIAGEEYTEVFRIRRTWGDPDFYAMAINGYTDDSYGQYVNKVLPTLSKADLRLLRNTIFAIYGVHFKSTDLSTHFNKQVWYTDEGKTSGEIILPAHRHKLVEMIQKLEK